MTRMTTHRRVLAVLGALLVAWSAAPPAHAWESAGTSWGMETWNPWRGIAPWPFPGTHFGAATGPYTLQWEYLEVSRWEQEEGPDYLLHTLYYELGDAGTPEGVLGLYQCSREAVAATGFELGLCDLIVGDPHRLIGQGWLKPRLRWNSEPPGELKDQGVRPEHMLIVEDAAVVAGLDATAIFAPFWIRYPSEDKYVVAPVYPDDPATEVSLRAGLVVGQSLTPAPLAGDHAYVVRGVHLPELAQLPDASLSIWDWASGNEICPQAFVQEVFGPQNEVNACHDEWKIFGLMDALHYGPATRDMYLHYHLLALNRMEACATLSAAWEALPPENQNLDFTTYSEFEEYMFEGYSVPAPRYRSPDDTPAHECEREAMVFEMVAQHYLHDAWSTGHMWRRWGYAQFLDYPDTLGPSPYALGEGFAAEDDLNPPATDVWSRRYVIAQVVRHMGAMIAGYQDILLAMDATDEDAVGDTVRHIADPLNAPFFTQPWSGEQREVEWVDAADGAYPERGVGDLFYDPTGPALARLRSGGVYTTQRQRLLLCSARSLRDVYGIGAQLHGPIGPQLPVSGLTPDGIDDISAFCFDHYVTNASMYGALGPFHVTQTWSATAPPVTTAGMFSILNEVILDDGSGANLYFDDPADGVAFLDATSERMQLDAKQLELRLAYNATFAPDGVESASFASGDPDLPAMTRFLNVESNSGVDTAGTFGEGMLVPWLDTAPVDPGPATSSVDAFVPRMFWRAHIGEQVCADAELAPKLLTLRATCIAAAQYGGDPDICTACVEATEPVMPMCGWGQTFPQDVIGPSRCEALIGQNPPDLPDAWRLIEDRFLDAHGYWSCLWPPYFAALEWCTDTHQDPDSLTTGQMPISDTGTNTTCDPIDEANAWWNSRKYRTAMLTDSAPSYYAGPPGMVTAVVDEVSYTPVSDPFPGAVAIGWQQCSYRPVHSTQPRINRVLGDLPYWNDYETLDPAFHPADVFGGYKPRLLYERCGARQRVSYWDVPCSEVEADYAGAWLWPEAPDTIQPESGAYYLDGVVETAPRCSLVHGRELIGECGIGICNAGGSCTASLVPPTLLTLDKLEDQPCGDVPVEGCCVDEIAARCAGGFFVEKICDTTGQTARGCGWHNGLGRYDCVMVPGTTDPEGTHPIACPIP